MERRRRRNRQPVPIELEIVYLLEVGCRILLGWGRWAVQHVWEGVGELGCWCCEGLGAVRVGKVEVGWERAGGWLARILMGVLGSWW